MANRQASKHPGVRYREHETRKHGVRPDRYFMIRLFVDGKSIEEACGWASEGMTEHKAANLRAELMENKRRGSGPRTLAEKRALDDEARRKKEQQKAQQAREGLTFGELFENHYTPSSKSHKSKKTWEREEGLYLKRIKPVIGKKPLKDIAPIDIERIKADMTKAGNAPYSIGRALGVVRAVFNWAVKRDLFDRANPVTKVKIPRGDNRRVRFLSYEEADALLAEITKTSPQVHDMALLSLHCGLRAGEVFALTWGDVDVDRGVLTLRDTKSGKTRPAFMTVAVKEVFRGMERGSPSELVFKDRWNGGRIQKISRTFTRAVDALKLNEGVEDRRQRVCFHTLRHTYASWHVESGTDLYVVKELLGHSDIRMTARYSHLGENTLQAATKRLEGTLAKTPTKIIEMKKKEG